MNNPAGRLHALLLDLSQRSGGVSLRAAWSEVLGVTESEVPLYLGAVGELLADIDRAAKASNSDATEAQVTRHRDEWAKPIFPSEAGFDATLNRFLPHEGSLEALAMVATYLSAVAPEGRIPEPSRLEEMQDELRGLLDEVGREERFPPQLKQAIASRLLDVMRAIEHVRIGGPDAVKLAMEALVGTVEARDERVAKSKLGRKIATYAAISWAAFASGPTVERGIESWGNIAHELVSGAEDLTDARTGDDDPMPATPAPPVKALPPPRERD